MCKKQTDSYIWRRLMGNEGHHNYEYDTNLKGESSPAKLLKMVGQNKRVLELGAGPGSITKHMKFEQNCEVVALEIDEQAISKLTPFCDKVIQANLNDLTWPELLKNEKNFDVIVIADVLEHIYDPWATLKLLPELLNDEGFIVISLPHAGHSGVIASLLLESLDYRESGLLDKTHIRFFGLKNIQSLVNDNKLDIEDAQYVILPPEVSELSNYWLSLDVKSRDTLSSYTYGSVYQVVIKAVPSSRSIENINLMSVAVGQLNKKTQLFLKFKLILKTIIPKRYYERMKSKARKLGIKGY